MKDLLLSSFAIAQDDRLAVRAGIVGTTKEQGQLLRLLGKAKFDERGAVYKQYISK